MTEKTDIAALRRRSNNLRTADQTDAFIDLLLDKLEAERQQRVEAEAELAAPRGEQEPVAYMYRDNLHSDARFSLTPKISNWSREDISEYEIAEIPLFTRQPKPVVVLPPRKSAKDYVDDEFTNADLAAIYNAARLELKVRIQNAGIVVKDGE